MNREALRLLVVLDESELGVHTAAMAAALAQRLGAEITLHVAIAIEHIDARSAAGAMNAMLQHQEACRQRAAGWFARAHAVVQPLGISTNTVLTMDVEPCEAVLRMADEHHCSLIVVGSHGRGTVSRALSGSLVADLVRLSHRPVLVCREDMSADWLPADA